MNLKTGLVIAAVVLAFVAVADLTTGNSNKPILPAPIGDQLTQQGDVVLLAIAGGLFVYSHHV